MKQIRLWKLGNVQHGLYPTQEAIDNFCKILSQWDGISDFDIIWGPDVSVEVIDIGNKDCGDIVTRHKNICKEEILKKGIN